VNTDNGTHRDITLADLRKEFGWTCWQEGDEWYTRHPLTPASDYDARGDDPQDLREAILLALKLNRPGHTAIPTTNTRSHQESQ
jgi:hypothetical protein